MQLSFTQSVCDTEVSRRPGLSGDASTVDAWVGGRGAARVSDGPCEDRGRDSSLRHPEPRGPSDLSAGTLSFPRTVSAGRGHSRGRPVHSEARLIKN